MPDSLLLAQDGERTFSAGNIAGNGALSIVAIVKPTSISAGYQWLFNWNSMASAFGIFDAVTRSYDGTTESGGPTLLAAGEWYLIGYTKASGTATPNGHLYRYSTTTWTHSAMSATQVNFPSLTSLLFGGTGSEWFIGSILIAGVWDSVLSQATVETLISAKADWVTAAPDEAWRFDTTGTITPFVGTSTQTSSTGGTLDTGDAPAGWTDEETTPQVLAPSADSVDGNWTNQAGSTTDLFDSINETTASDTDYIRSELGPANSATRIKLASGGDPQSSTGHEINWRIAKDAAGGQTIGMTVKLYQGGGNSVGGGTLIASFTRSNVTNTFTDFTEALSGAEADSITNYADLYLEFWANAT